MLIFKLKKLLKSMMDFYSCLSTTRLQPRVQGLMIEQLFVGVSRVLYALIHLESAKFSIEKRNKQNSVHNLLDHKIYQLNTSRIMCR